MIDYHTFQQIRQLHDEEHLSCSQIARRLGLHWQTVKKWVGRPRYEQRAAPPPTRRPSKLDAFKGTIVRWLESHPFTGAQLFSRLRAEGYQGGYSILKDFVREVRPKAAPAFLTLHFAPGQCAQVDWGSWGTIRVGATRRALSFFVMVLCWSRRLFVEFTLGQGQEQWLACHQHAFAYFDHLAPAELMVDNCKTAVLSHPVGGPPVLNPAYLDFAGHHGCTIKACGPRQPQAKGRVESAVAYVKKNLLAGLDLTDLATLNAATRLWLDTVANVRLHGETQRTPLAMFAEERPRLRPLPAQPYDAARVATVRASNRCRVTVETNRYSVPAAQASAQLTLKLDADRLRLYAGDQLVAEHLRCYERRQDCAHPEHAAALLHDRRQARDQQLLLQFLRLSPQAQAYHAQLTERRVHARPHVQKIVALSEIFGVAATARALEDAHALHAYSCEYIANLLEQRQRFLPAPGALQLTRQSDLLDLELPPPDLSIYEPKAPRP
jgi:transposase